MDTSPPSGRGELVRVPLMWFPALILGWWQYNWRLSVTNGSANSTVASVDKSSMGSMLLLSIIQSGRGSSNGV